MKQRFLSASALILATALWTAPALAQQKSEAGKITTGTTLSVTSDSPDGTGETSINYVEDGRRYKIKLNGSTIVDMSVDGKKLSPDEYSKYDSMVKKILAQIEKDREQAKKDREQAERDREQAAIDRVQAEKDRLQAQKDREQAERDRAQAERDRVQAMRDREQADRDRMQAEKDRQQAVKDREQAEKDRRQAEEDRKLMEAMIDELVKEKLVENRAAITSLELDDTELLINGKAQPENIHKQFKEKYLKGKNNRINYRNSGVRRSLSLD